MSYYDYFLDRDFKFYRLVFNWNVMQPILGGDLSTPLLAHMDPIIDHLTGAGAIVILDQHDYMRRDDKIIGESEITSAQYAELWRRLAQRYGENPKIWFGLMNEPHDVDRSALAISLNAAISSIRRAGATNWILCPGSDWCNGERWLKSGNDKLADLIRKDDALLFEVHQYLDEWGRGQSPVAEPGSGHRLDAVSAWARRTGRHLFLGEFSAGPDPATLAELRTLLETLATYSDVWAGYCYWSSGGGKTSDRWYCLDPVDGRDRPQMRLLTS